MGAYTLSYPKKREAKKKIHRVKNEVKQMHVMYVSTYDCVLTE